MFAKATRAVGEEVKFDSLTRLHRSAHHDSELSPKKLFLMFTKKQRGGKNTVGQEEQPKNNSGQQSELYARTEDQTLEVAEATGFSPKCAPSAPDT